MSDSQRKTLEISLLFAIGIIILLIYKVSEIKKEKNEFNYLDNLKIQQVNKEINSQEIKQEELETIISNELDILYGKTSMNDITNQDKLSIGLKILKKSSTNDGTFTKDELESAFNKTCLSKLGIIHENIIPISNDNEDGNPLIGYTFTDGIYNNEILLNSTFIQTIAVGKKSIKFNNDNGKYTISIKYLFGEPSDDIMNVHKVYGKNKEEIGEIPIELLIGGKKENIQIWFEQNYEAFKDKLETYNYVFTKENDKISLIDFYIN
ncbi:MAG: hypothetical protein J6B64_01215 [Bacilli bacterium]|nr:hypothetical protein [Bacilli bacterium]MBP3920040.1 hypothetical protein [Bacilli bacterium]